MKSDVVRRLMDSMPDSIKQIVYGIEDRIDAKIFIKEAYELYMPQDKREITQLTEFILDKCRKCENSPYIIVEIGTKFGGTFHIWNRIVEQHSKKGLCVSVDMSDGGLHGGISEDEMDDRDVKFSERFRFSKFIRGDSHKFETHYKVRDVINTDIRPWSGTIDFLFIDGDHSYRGVKDDFEMYSPFVKKGGCIAFHDIVISPKHHDRNVYVGEYWRDLTNNKTTNDKTCVIDDSTYQVYEFVNGTLDWAGIGVLVKL